MNGFDLLANNRLRQVQVDAGLDRIISLTKNRNFAVPSHSGLGRIR
jgi:hypothetical protein